MGVRAFSTESRLILSSFDTRESKVSAISSTQILILLFLSDELLLLSLVIVDNSLIELTYWRFFDFCDLLILSSLFYQYLTFYLFVIIHFLNAHISLACKFLVHRFMRIV